MRSFFFQALHTVFSRGAVLVCAFATGIAVARFLGTEGRGELALFLVIPTLVVSFGEFGMRQSAAYLIGQKEYSLEDIQASLMALCMVTTLASAAIVLCGYYFQDLLEGNFWVVVIFLLQVPASLLPRYLSALLMGRQKIEGLNRAEVMDAFIHFVLTLLLLGALHLGLFGAAFAILAGRGAALLVTLWSLRDVVSLRPRWVSPLPGMILKMGFLYGISLVILNLNYRVDVLMLGKMRGLESVGIYTTGVSIAELLRHLPLSVGVVLFSRSINMRGSTVQDHIHNVARLSRISILLVAACAAGIALVAQWAVPFIYGAEFAESTKVIWCLLPGVVTLTLFINLQLFVAGQGKPQLSLVAFLPALLLNILLNLYAIPRWDYVGAACVSTVTYSLASFVFVGIFCRKYGVRPLEVVMPQVVDVHYLWGKVIMTPNKMG